MKPYVIDGFPIERVGTYRLVAIFQHGPIKTIATSDDPAEARTAEHTVARNPEVIRRIELHDSGGPIETIWDADKEHMT